MTTAPKNKHSMLLKFSLVIAIFETTLLRQVIGFSNNIPLGVSSSSSLSESKEATQEKWLTTEEVEITDSVKSSVHDREWTKLLAVKQWWTDDDNNNNAIVAGETVKLQRADFIPSLWGLKGVPEPIVREPKETGGDDHVRFVVYSIGGKMTNILSLSCNKEFPLIPHVGVRIYGKEWFYSDHVESRQSLVMEKMLSVDTYPQCQFDLGPTTCTTEEIADWLSDAQERYNKESYNLWTKNCNHFAKDFASFLLPEGDGIPTPIMDPVIDFTDSMLDNLPEWRRAAGNYFMDKLSRTVVVSWGGVVKKEKKRIKEELQQQAAAAAGGDDTK